MKENRIKLAAVIIGAFIFMLVFTCCVNKDIPEHICDDGHKQITLFSPPLTSPDEEITTDDFYYTTTKPVVTLSPDITTEVTTEEPVTTQFPVVETTKTEDTVFGGFSGIY